MGLWRMDETPAQMLASYPALQLLDMPYKSEGRQKEFLAVRALAQEMTGRTDLSITYAPSGKPQLEGWQLSISHTRGYAVVILSDMYNVAIDIEYQSDRVARIADKFIRPDEVCTTTADQLLLWSAKETLYKLHSEDNLQYADMRLLKSNDGDLIMENMKRRRAVRITYCDTDAYVLTWTEECLPADDIESGCAVPLHATDGCV